MWRTLSASTSQSKTHLCIYIYIYIYENADTIFKEQFISPNHSSFPTDDFHLFAENRPSIDHNESMLNKF